MAIVTGRLRHFLRVETEAGVNVQMVQAKMRVAPLKMKNTVTLIPR